MKCPFFFEFTVCLEVRNIVLFVLQTLVRSVAVR